jgi:pimeloyl-ACP methyl ester carboxylesterase
MTESSLSVSPAARVSALSASGISYTRRGDGPPVVLLHGWCLNRGLWKYQEDALMAGYTVICPDLAGFGASAGLAGPYSLERYARDLLDLLVELDLADVTVAGFAFGAAVAMAASTAPDSRIGALVLVAPPSAAHAPYLRMPKAMRRDWPDFARRSAAAIVNQPHSEATLSWLELMFGATELPVAVETVGLLAAFEPAAVAPDVSVSTLLIHGAQDDVVPISVSEECARSMPDARLESVPDCGHLVLIDQHQRCTELLVEFLAARGAGRTATPAGSDRTI